MLPTDLVDINNMHFEEKGAVERLREYRKRGHLKLMITNSIDTSESWIIGGSNFNDKCCP